MKVLKVEPKKYPEVVEIDSALESLQKEVGGPIQAVYPWDDEVALICNEEGKLVDKASMNYNRVLATEIGVPYDVVVGPFLIVGLTEDDFGDLPQEFIDKYEKMFHDPEEFSFWTDAHGKTHLDVRPYVPEDNSK